MGNMFFRRYYFLWWVGREAGSSCSLSTQESAIGGRKQFRIAGPTRPYVWCSCRRTRCIVAWNSLQRTMYTLDILFEDEHLLAINKPAGISVHPSLHEPDGTLVNIVLEQFPDIAGVGDPARPGSDNKPGSEERPGIVHRLDKETSGVMVVAKTQEAFQGLKALFQERKVEKHYLAIVDGVIKPPRGKIELPIGRVGLRMRVVRPGQKGLLKQRDALTRYIVRKRFFDATLVELVPKTGRMHQIRVHLHSLGRPVLGDRLYGGRRVKARAPRQMLHAWKLVFSLFDTEYAFEVDPPADFEDMLEALAFEDNSRQDIQA